MNSKAKVLIVLTSHSQISNTDKETGYYLSELSHPYEELIQKGLHVDIVSLKGNTPPMDANSFDLTDPINKAFWENNQARQKLENTLKLEEVDSKQYKAILFAGGHGTMWDFPEDKDVQRVGKEIYEHGGIVAAVCHGPAALVNLKLSNGEYLVNKKHVTAFSNEEEESIGLTLTMPFLLETVLKDRQAVFTKAPLWQAHVVVSERLVTGQNPASARGVATKIAELISQI